MHQIGRLDFLISNRRDEVFLQHLGCNKGKPFQACSTHDRQHLCLPEQVIVLGRLLRYDMAEQRVGGSGASLHDEVDAI
jgi:hypothetical protein